MANGSDINSCLAGNLESDEGVYIQSRFRSEFPDRFSIRFNLDMGRINVNERFFCRVASKTLQMREAERRKR
jgi:hypothetical protein